MLLQYQSGYFITFLVKLLHYWVLLHFRLSYVQMLLHFQALLHYKLLHYRVLQCKHVEQADDESGQSFRLGVEEVNYQFCLE